MVVEKINKIRMKKVKFFCNKFTNLDFIELVPDFRVMLYTFLVEESFKLNKKIDLKSRALYVKRTTKNCRVVKLVYIAIILVRDIIFVAQVSSLGF